jgi:ABC-type multidrug transport system fused ATPase/permease subunit
MQFIKTILNRIVTVLKTITLYEMWPFFNGMDKTKVVLATGISCVNTSANILGPLAFSSAVSLIAESEPSVSFMEIEFTPVQLLAIFGTLITASMTLPSIRAFVMSGVYENAFHRLSESALRDIFNLSLQTHIQNKNEIRSILDNIQTGVGELVTNIVLSINPFIIELGSSLGVIFYLYGYDYVLPFLGFAGFYILIDHFLSNFYNSQLSSINSKVIEVSSSVYDTLENIETVIYYNNKQLEYENAIKLVKNLAQFKSGFSRKVASIDFLRKVTYGIAIILFATVNGSETNLATVTDFAFICIYLINFFGNINGIDAAIRQVRNAQLNLQIVNDLRNLSKDDDWASGISRIISINHLSSNPLIEFRQVSFKYPGEEKFVLNNFNLIINRGETIAIIGKSGCGKSTIAKLLMRVYVPTSGQIFIDGNDITSVDINNLHSLVGIAVPNPGIFNQTLRYNVFYGNSEIGEGGISQDFQKTLHTILKGLIDRGKTKVSKYELSSGEKQRIEIARLIIKDSLINILDEPSSSLDAFTEHKMIKQLNKITQNKTNIIIAHRLYLIANVNRIVVLNKNGEKIEEGAHDELLRLNGTYLKMWQLQNHSFLSINDESNKGKEKEKEIGNNASTTYLNDSIEKPDIKIHKGENSYSVRQHRKFSIFFNQTGKDALLPKGVHEEEDVENGNSYQTFESKPPLAAQKRCSLF